MNSRLIVLGCVLFACGCGQGNQADQNTKTAEQSTQSAEQSMQDTLNTVNRMERESKESFENFQYGEGIAANQKGEVGEAATFKITNVGGDATRAKIYLERKLSSMAWEIAKAMRKKNQEINKDTIERANKKALEENRWQFRYERIDEYVGTSTTLVSESNGEYTFRVTPVKDLQKFSQEAGFGKIVSLDAANNHVHIQSTLPSPAPDFDFERLQEKHGHGKVASVILSDTTDFEIKQFYAVEKRLIENIKDDSRFIFGPKDYGDGKLFYVMGPVADLSEYSGNLNLGAVKNVDATRREFQVDVSLPGELPEPPTAYDLTLSIHHESRPHKIKFLTPNPSKFLLTPRTVALTAYDRSPQPLENHLEWVVRILKTADSRAVGDVLFDLPGIPVDEQHLNTVSEALCKLLASGSYADTEGIVNAILAWRTEQGVRSILGILRAETPNERVVAIKALASIKTKQVAEALIKQLNDKDNYMQACISIKLLGPVAEESVLPLLTNKAPLVRGTACDLMGAVGTKTGLPQLKRLTRDKDKAVKSEAETSIVLIESRLSTTKSQNTSENDNEVDRFILDIRSGEVDDAGYALGQLNNLKVDSTRREILISVLQAKFAETRAFDEKSLVSAVAKWKDSAALSILASVLQNKRSSSHAHIIEELANLQTKPAADLIASRLGDFFDKRNAYKALMEMGPAAEETALELTQNKDIKVKAVGCEILASVGTEKSYPVLKKLAKNRNKSLAALAVSTGQSIENRLANPTSVVVAINSNDTPEPKTQQPTQPANSTTTETQQPKPESKIAGQQTNFQAVPENLTLPQGTIIQAKQFKNRDNWRDGKVVSVIAGGRMVRVLWNGSPGNAFGYDATIQRANMQISKQSLDQVQKNQPVAVTEKTPLKAGSQIQAEWANRWLPATVLALNNDGSVLIHWEGYDKAFDETISRSKLRYFPLSL